MEFLQWLQDSSLSIWVSESESVWAYPTILTAHTFGLAIFVGANIVINLRLLRLAPSIPLGSLKSLFWLMWVALAINAISGGLLFVSAATKTGTNPMYWAKMVLVAISVGVFLQIRRIVLAADATPQAAQPDRTRLLVIASFVLWAAAITAGRLTAYCC